MLEHLRVLDLSDERGLLCGRILADLGAQVVQVEPLEGSTARRTAPLVEDGRSMFWESYAAGKRGIALDLDDAAGLEVVRDLARRADIVITSASPAWLTERGIAPEDLRRDHRSLITVTITAFGWDGPKSRYADTDLVVWAAGGPLEPHRDQERPPLRISVPQAYLHAAADAAAGALIAVHARRATERGQTVDVSAQAALGTASLSRVLAAGIGDENPEWHKEPQAGKDQSGSGAATPHHRKKWRCRDGLIELHLSMGPASGGFTNSLFTWLSEEGAAPDDVVAWDWRTLPQRIESGEIALDEIDRVREVVRVFLARKTKRDVLEAAMRHRLLCVGIFDMDDIAATDQFAERDLWADLPVAGRELRIPGRLAHVRGAPAPRVRGRAPEIGEHTDTVLAEWGVREEVSR